MFKKIEGMEIQDKLNKNKTYSIGFYQSLNIKNIYKYSTAVYHVGIGSLNPINDSRKRFKNKEEAYNFYLELIKMYK